MKRFGISCFAYNLYAVWLFKYVVNDENIITNNNDFWY